MTFLLRQLYVYGAKTASTALGLDADAFVQFAQEDPTEQDQQQSSTAKLPEEKAIHWSGQANLSGGDVGTRNEQMGLPRQSGV